MRAGESLVSPKEITAEGGCCFWILAVNVPSDAVGVIEISATIRIMGFRDSALETVELARYVKAVSGSVTIA